MCLLVSYMPLAKAREPWKPRPGDGISNWHVPASTSILQAASITQVYSPPPLASVAEASADSTFACSRDNSARGPSALSSAAACERHAFARFSRAASCDPL